MDLFDTPLQVWGPLVHLTLKYISYRQLYDISDRRWDTGEIYTGAEESFAIQFLVNLALQT
jgi:hypothetical protein